MVRKMFEKAGLIHGLQSGVRSVVDASETAKPKTAPGTMMSFLTEQSTALREAESLRERVKSLESESALRLLDPLAIKSSRWANRHEASFVTVEFQELKTEISLAGGNVQPIKVRPIRVLNGSTPPAAGGFELVFGHRRHRACLELGLPVLAVVEETTDVSLFEQMERENRGRKNLSAWEQGVMYRKALDDGLYSSLRRLSESLGVDLSLVSKSVSLARLPEEVVAAFATPLDIQFRWASVLAEAMQKDPEGTLERARGLSVTRGEMAPTAVLAKVIGASEPVLNGSTPSSLTISVAGKIAATLTSDRQGRAVLRFESGALPELKRKALVKLIEGFLKV